MKITIIKNNIGLFVFNDYNPNFIHDLKQSIPSWSVEYHEICRKFIYRNSHDDKFKNGKHHWYISIHYENKLIEIANKHFSEIEWRFENEKRTAATDDT